jgi:hypothetical protein
VVVEERIVVLPLEGSVEDAKEVGERHALFTALLLGIPSVPLGTHSSSGLAGRPDDPEEPEKPVELPAVPGPHLRRSSVMVRDAPGVRPRFRAVCSCGWTSDPVEAEQTVFVWMRHAADPGPGR